MENEHVGQMQGARGLLAAAVAPVLAFSIPAKAQECGDFELTRSLSLEIVEGEGIACASFPITAENSFARCYPPSDASFSVRCVDIGIEDNTGSDLRAAVNIYIDVDGCPPTHPDLDLVLLASEPFNIPSGTFLELFEIELSAPVVVNAGETLVVELDYPAHTDGGVWPGSNDAGETAPTYIRSEPCGFPNYITIPDLFPCCDWVQIVRGEVPCPGDLDADGSVGILDLLALLAAWGTDPGGPPDFDGDGNVGILDLLTLFAAWGPCP
ncbi:MAG: hypothetical protein IH988_05885 [Planctomycetes bacterium]|nr:hypothetical protein [Planctomycetota bacterium]